MNDLAGMLRERGSERSGLHRARSAIAVGLSVVALGLATKVALDETNQTMLQQSSDIEPASAEPVCTTGKVLFSQELENGNASLQVHEKLDSVTEIPKGYVCVRLLSDSLAWNSPRYMSLAIDSLTGEDHIDSSNSYTQYAGWLAVGLGEKVTIHAAVDPISVGSYGSRSEAELTMLYTAQYNERGQIDETTLLIDDFVRADA